MFRTLSYAALLSLGASMSAWAIPAATLDSPPSSVIKVYEGCGPYGHRGPGGACRPGGQDGGYVPGRSCPRGFHIGPYGRRCVPN